MDGGHYQTLFEVCLSLPAFSFCSCSAEGEKGAGFVEKELAARVMGTRADIVEKVSGESLFCGKPAKGAVYAGKSY